MSRMGYHWSPCNRGSSGVGGIVTLIIAILIVAKWHTIERTAITVIQVIAIAGSCLVAIAIAIAVTVAIRRTQHDQIRVYQQSETGLIERLADKHEIPHRMPELSESQPTRNIVVLPIDAETGYIKRTES